MEKMPVEPLPRRLTESGNREFVFFPVAAVVLLINDREEFLLLRHPRRAGWEVVNGALEDGETWLQGALREVAEEAGSAVEVRPLGPVHVESFHYDRRIPFMLSINYLMHYRDGLIEPGDDMHGSAWGWFSIDDIVAQKIPILVPPPTASWVFERALQLFRLLRDTEIPCLQYDINLPRARKY